MIEFLFDSYEWEENESGPGVGLGIGHLSAKYNNTRARDQY